MDDQNSLKNFKVHQIISSKYFFMTDRKNERSLEKQGNRIIRDDEVILYRKGEVGIYPSIVNELKLFL